MRGCMGRVEAQRIAMSSLGFLQTPQVLQSQAQIMVSRDTLRIQRQGLFERSDRGRGPAVRELAEGKVMLTRSHLELVCHDRAWVTRRTAASTVDSSVDRDSPARARSAIEFITPDSTRASAAGSISLLR